jgi:Ca2+-binding RTX toxin-like protein
LGTSDTLDSNNQVRVLSGGSVGSIQGTGGIAMRVLGIGSSVYNEGTISGGYAVLIGANAAGSTQVVNHGTISGDVYAVRHYNVSTDALTVRNYGTITALGTGIAFSSTEDSAAIDTVRNHGLITGDVKTGAVADLVRNSGLIDGDIVFGTGNDQYQGRKGEVTGTVFGDAGNDTMQGNAAEEDVLDGGSDIDTLTFRTGPAVTLALNQSFENDGAAFGDAYSGFEIILGSNTGADMIRGDSAANTITGYGGNDTLDGAGGSDVLRGGNGADRMTGGAASDTFLYYTLDECGDTITDYSNVAGNDDKFRISVAIGGGLVAGTLSAAAFQLRTDNVAQDADDRFIYRTTDQTLWFDPDGTGAGAAVMLADLQPGASLTFADITLF